MPFSLLHAIKSLHHFMFRIIPSPSWRMLVLRRPIKPRSTCTSLVSPVMKLNVTEKLGSSSMLLMGLLNSITWSWVASQRPNIVTLPSSLHDATYSSFTSIVMSLTVVSCYEIKNFILYNWAFIWRILIFFYIFFGQNFISIMIHYVNTTPMCAYH